MVDAEGNEGLVKAKEQARLLEIKMDLRRRCDQIPFSVWTANFPDLQIPLLEHRAGSLPRIGHDEVHSFLSRSGLVLLKLVHYNSDGYDSEKRFPDEILGEADYTTYKDAHQIAVIKLEWLKEGGLQPLSRS